MCLYFYQFVLRLIFHSVMLSLFHLGGLEMNFSTSQNMAIHFSSGLLIQCKNQQMKDCFSRIISYDFTTFLWF